MPPDRESLAGLVSAVPRTLRLLRSQYRRPELLSAAARRQLDDTLRAARRIPFYADRLPSGGNDDLAAWPVLKRADVRDLGRSVRSLHPPGTRFLASSSSGSTGMPVELLFDASHQRGRFAARARYLWENGWTPITRGAWIISLPPADTPDGALVRGRLAPGARFLSHGTPFPEQLAWLEALQPVYLYTLPSNLEGLMVEVEKRRFRLPSLRRLFTGAEVLDDAVRERARSLFALEIADNYGSTEAFLAWQCPRGGYHVNAEHVAVEIVDAAGRPAAPGEMGRVLVTTLENWLMPLVRYEIGDWAFVAGGGCPCGRTLPLVGRVVGRGVNLFRRPDGTLFTPWHLVGPLKRCERMRQFQIVQRTLDAYAVRYAADADLDAATEAELRAAFVKVLGEGASVAFEHVSEVPRAPSGKFMTAWSELAS